MDSDTDMSTFARPTISLDPPPPLESRFPKEHMPAIQRMQDNNSGSSDHKPSTPSPLLQEIQFANKIPSQGMAVSGLARMKVKTRKAFARQIRIELMQLHRSWQQNSNDTHFMASQDPIEDLRDMFENLWVSSPRICGWRTSTSSSKTPKRSRRLHGVMKGRSRHSCLTYGIRYRKPHPSLTRGELLASFVRATSRRFLGHTMPKRRSGERFI